MAETRHPLIELTLARLREVGREPAVLFWVFGFPILLAIGLGIAFRTRPPEKVQVAVVSDDPQLLERTVRELSPSEHIAPLALSDGAAHEALRKAKVDLVLTVFTASAATFRFDESQLGSRYAKELVDHTLQSARGRADVITVESQPVSEEGRRYIDFLVPGLIGLNLMGSSMWGIGYAVVDTRARRLMKRFAATPMRRSYYLLSFILSRFLLLITEVIVLTAFGTFAFGVKVHGGWLDLAITTMMGALAFAGLALLIAARPTKPEVASGWMNFVMMPMYLLSGAFFSYERFPETVQPWIRALPLTALNDALRAVINDGASIVGCGSQLAVLGLWGVISFVLALKLFRWQ